MAYTLFRDLTTVNRTVMNNKVNRYIVIHYTGNQTDTAKNNANYFRSVDRKASAHYFVDKTTVYQVVEDKDAAWSVGKNYGSGNLFQTVKNNNSINIEMCSDNGAVAEETFQNTVALTKSLMEKYHIPASNIYRHYDVCSKRCPGWTGWVGADETLWNRFKQAVSSSFAPAPAPAAPASSAPATGPAVTAVSARPSYRVGQTYTTQVELNVRKGAGTDSARVGYPNLTANAKQHDKDRDGAIDKGTAVTCKAVKTLGNDIWIQIPSGWIAAYYLGNVYVK
ncbi:MAG: N-acetylmuramoyl-L-alanine amidase [Lachnospiraceae bacterium]|nr:N-acetylmuramoyl-L-alanine amidase [Lachnospiraceae bacterium]